MKRAAVWIALLAWTIASPALAEEPAPETPPAAGLSPFSLGAHLSYWNAKDLDEFDLDGMLGGGVIGRFRLHDYVGLELRLSGYAAGESEDIYVEGRGWYESDLTVVAMPMEFGLVGFLPLGDTFELYGGPGAGFYLFDGEYTVEQGPWETTYDLDLDDEGGFYVLLGLRAELARNIALYAEAKYTWVETTLEALPRCSECEDADEVDRDIDFSGLAVNAGMIFTF